mmetsp:Transcript_37050/g.60663  ORF Transcript_37050/g.60663 Transcript_37050/m.60663 type:complete len:225 (-) Transcript_37050:154-828(-)
MCHSLPNPAAAVFSSSKPASNFAVVVHQCCCCLHCHHSLHTRPHQSRPLSCLPLLQQVPRSAQASCRRGRGHRHQEEEDRPALHAASPAGGRRRRKRRRGRRQHRPARPVRQRDRCPRRRRVPPPPTPGALRTLASSSARAVFFSPSSWVSPLSSRSPSCPTFAAQPWGPLRLLPPLHRTPLLPRHLATSCLLLRPPLPQCHSHHHCPHPPPHSTHFLLRSLTP